MNGITVPAPYNEDTPSEVIRAELDYVQRRLENKHRNELTERDVATFRLRQVQLENELMRRATPTVWRDSGATRRPCSALLPGHKHCKHGHVEDCPNQGECELLEGYGPPMPSEQSK